MPQSMTTWWPTAFLTLICLVILASCLIAVWAALALSSLIDHEKKEDTE